MSYLANAGMTHTIHGRRHRAQGLVKGSARHPQSPCNVWSRFDFTCVGARKALDDFCGLRIFRLGWRDLLVAAENFGQRPGMHPQFYRRTINDRSDDILTYVRFGVFFSGDLMKPNHRQTTTSCAIRRAASILARLEREGADFVQMDGEHAYIWHRDELVSLFNHRQVITFLSQHHYVGSRTENKMIIAACIIFEGLKRCA